MPTHDIIDNREQTLRDHVRKILATTDAARFAVGYFFVSGPGERRRAARGRARAAAADRQHHQPRDAWSRSRKGYRRLEIVGGRGRGDRRTRGAPKECARWRSARARTCAAPWS